MYLQNLIKKNEWKTIAFIRLNPAFPGPINYILGLTSISPKIYCIGTILFLIPPTFFFSFLGNSIGIWVINGDIPDAATKLIILSFGIIIFSIMYVFFRNKNIT